MKIRILHVHFDEYLKADGLHLIAPNDGHDEVQAAVREGLLTGTLRPTEHDEPTIWVHHAYWPKGEVVEYEIIAHVEK